MEEGLSYKEGKVLLVDKPLHWTSFQVVNKLRWKIRHTFGFKKIKVGHAGTLDPLASGLLIVCCGKETKNIESYQGQTKKYTGTFFIGATTPSYDLETEVNEHFEIKHIDASLIEEARQKFTGHIQQQPPVFSAVQKDGVRMYERARKGEQVDMPFRTVEILDFKLTRIALPEIDFEVRCSKGTYIRSLAYDFGKALQSGAYLKALRRTAIGDYSVDQALSVEEWLKEIESI